MGPAQIGKFTLARPKRGSIGRERTRIVNISLLHAERVCQQVRRAKLVVQPRVELVAVVLRGGRLHIGAGGGIGERKEIQEEQGLRRHPGSRNLIIRDRLLRVGIGELFQTREVSRSRCSRGHQRVGCYAGANPDALIIHKEKELSFLMGPPKMPPNWFLLSSGLVSAKKLRASILSLRRNSYRSP